MHGCQAATDLLFTELSKLPRAQEMEDGIVQQCLHAGANPIRPGGAAGHLPLQHLCIQEMHHPEPPDPMIAKRVASRVAQAVSQLTEAAPLVLIMAFASPQANEAALPLEAAALNKSLGRVIVPVLSSAVGRLLLQRPALAAAPLLRRAVEVAHKKFPDVSFVTRLAEIIHAAAPCLDSASDASGKQAIWEPRCAYENWTLRERRLAILRPLLEQLGAATVDGQREEAVARLAELEAVLDRRLASLWAWQKIDFGWHCALTRA